MLSSTLPNAVVWVVCRRRWPGRYVRERRGLGAARPGSSRACPPGSPRTPGPARPPCSSRTGPRPGAAPALPARRGARRRPRAARVPGGGAAPPLGGGGGLPPGREPVDHPAARAQALGGPLDGEDAAARRHPLGVAVGDQAAAAVGV